MEVALERRIETEATKKPGLRQNAQMDKQLSQKPIS
jgi:hypothetical protein